MTKIGAVTHREDYRLLALLNVDTKYDSIRKIVLAAHSTLYLGDVDSSTFNLDWIKISLRFDSIRSNGIAIIHRCITPSSVSQLTSIACLTLNRVGRGGVEDLLALSPSPSPSPSSTNRRSLGVWKSRPNPQQHRPMKWTSHSEVHTNVFSPSILGFDGECVSVVSCCFDHDRLVERFGRSTHTCSPSPSPSIPSASPPTSPREPN